jgi:hypothetical protein
MKRIAFFVEGQTESIFLTYLIEQYFSPGIASMQLSRIHGNKTHVLRKAKIHSSTEFYVLIVNVEGDEKVTSAIKERAEKLFSQEAYEMVIAIRDLYPNDACKKNDIENAFSKIFSSYSYSNKIFLILSIMEVEAWFIAEHSVFSRLFPGAQTNRINNELGLCLENDNIESYNHPAKILGEISRMHSSCYDKKAHEIHAICSRIDFAELCFNEGILNKIHQFKCLMERINQVYC